MSFVWKLSLPQSSDLYRVIFVNRFVLPLYLLCIVFNTVAWAQTAFQGTGRVAVYGPNPHYLQDGNGTPFVLLGYNRNGNKQYASILDQLRGKVNYLRTTYASNNEDSYPQSYEIGNPVVKSGSLWDFDTWDETFWANLHDYLDNARGRGFIVGFLIWEGHYALPGGKNGSRSIWNSYMNKQGIQWDYDYNALVTFTNPPPTSSDPRERLVYYQRRWIDRFINEVKGYPNVLIELNNEDTGSLGASEQWWLWWAQYFKDRTNFVIAVNQAGSGEAISDTTFSRTPLVDMKSYHYRSDTSITATRLSYNKVIVADADNSSADLDATTARKIAWRSLTRGGHWNDYTEITGFPNTTKIDYYGKLLSFLATRNVPFWQMTPNQGLVSSGYALAKIGAYYLVYTESNVNVDLSGASGTLDYEWYDPRTGTSARSGQIQGGASRSFTLPSANDYVLWIKGSASDRIPPAAPMSLSGIPK